MFRIWVPDLDSPSYFVAVAAVELGFFKREGIDVEFVYKVVEGPELLRDGKIHFIGGPAFSTVQVFPEWKGVKLLCALSQYSYWFLAVRSSLDVRRGDLQALKGLRISAAKSWPMMGLEYMLASAGLDLQRDNIRLVAPPPAYGDKGYMARNGIQAIEQGIADAFWGNGMRVALGESLGIAKMHLDLRRGDGPSGARYYNFAALTTTERFIGEHPEVAAGAVRAIVKTQQVLKNNPSLSTQVGKRLFPSDEADLIAGLIERDAPFYSAEISQLAVDGLIKFAAAYGLIQKPVGYDNLAAVQFGHLWRG